MLMASLGIQEVKKILEILYWMNTVDLLMAGFVEHAILTERDMINIILLFFSLQ